MGVKINWVLVCAVIMLLLFLTVMGYAVVIEIRRRSSCESLGYDYYKEVGDKVNCCSNTLTKVINTDGTYFYEKHTKCAALDQKVLISEGYERIDVEIRNIPLSPSIMINEGDGE